MKLKNKISGEIKEFALFDGNELQGGATLESLTKEWEDYEELKEYYWLRSGLGDICKIEDTGTENDKFRKSIGNHFPSKEQAERAVEKLKAWRRLKDKGFKLFMDAFGEIHFRYYPPGEWGIKTAQENEACKADIKLLFGGEE